MFLFLTCVSTHINRNGFPYPNLLWKGTFDCRIPFDLELILGRIFSWVFNFKTLQCCILGLCLITINIEFSYF